jgi:hypothetical protein
VQVTTHNQGLDGFHQTGQRFLENLTSPTEWRRCVIREDDTPTFFCFMTNEPNDSEQQWQGSWEVHPRRKNTETEQ